MKITNAKKMDLKAKKGLIHDFLKSKPGVEKALRNRAANGQSMSVFGQTFFASIIKEVVEEYDEEKRKKFYELFEGGKPSRKSDVLNEGKENASNAKSDIGNRAIPSVEVSDDEDSPQTNDEEESSSKPAAPDATSANEATESSVKPKPAPEPAPEESKPDYPDSTASIGALKAYFTELGVEYRHRAFERTDLLTLLEEVKELLGTPLAELRQKANLTGGTKKECVRIILNPQVAASKKRESTGFATSSTSEPASKRFCGGAASNPEGGFKEHPFTTSAASSGGNGPGTTGYVVAEALRIGRVRETYSWWLNVFNLKHNATSEDIQKQFRNCMKLFHPDKVKDIRAGPNQAAVTDALDKIKRAKKEAEQELNKKSMSPPCAPTGLYWKLVNGMKGYRVIKLLWQHPPGPVDKYTIQVLDPQYGRFLSICVLEPDYMQDKQRFVSIEELNEYDIEERKMEKMAHLFEISGLVEFQVAAHNTAGQGFYSKIKVDLSGKTVGMRSPNTSAAPTPSGPDNDMSCEQFRVMLLSNSRDDNLVRSFLQMRKVREKRAFLNYLNLDSKGTSFELNDRISLWLRHR